MEGTTLQRIARLAGHLICQPRYLPSYVAHLPLWKRTPLDLELPWFSYGSIHYLKRALRPEHRVFEFGSGGSTVFFAQRTREVVSVENNVEWHDRVSARLNQLKLANVDCQLHAFGEGEAPGYAQLPYFNVLRPGDFDVIVVDGFCGFTTGRYGKLRMHSFAQACAAVRRPGGMVVVDDYWMFPETQKIAVGVRPHVFEGVGPCRYGVTSTAIFRFD